MPIKFLRFIPTENQHPFFMLALVYPKGGKDKTFYTVNTDFDLEKVLIDGSKENIALIGDIDLIAKELLKLKEAEVPVLWKPLHEADGRWFWWGAKGPENYKKLYYLLYELPTENYKLNNLIWIWNTPHPDWTIDENFYDIAGIDNYVPPENYGSMKFSFDYLGKLTSYKKPLALTENGPIPDPNLLFQYEAYFYGLCLGLVTLFLMKILLQRNI